MPLIFPLFFPPRVSGGEPKIQLATRLWGVGGPSVLERFNEGAGMGGRFKKPVGGGGVRPRKRFRNNFLRLRVRSRREPTKQLVKPTGGGAHTSMNEFLSPRVFRMPSEQGGNRPTLEGREVGF